VSNSATFEIAGTVFGEHCIARHRANLQHEALEKKCQEKTTSAGFEPAPWEKDDGGIQSFQATGGHHCLTMGPCVVRVYPSPEARTRRVEVIKVVAAFKSCCYRTYDIEDVPKRTMVNVWSTKHNPSKFRTCDLGEGQMLDRFERLASVVATIWLLVLTSWKRIHPYDLNLPVRSKVSPYSSRAAVKPTKSSIFLRRQISQWWWMIWARRA
jgi:hypothetical protein